MNEHHTEPGEYDRPAVAEAFDTVAVVSVYETDLQHYREHGRHPVSQPGTRKVSTTCTYRTFSANLCLIMSASEDATSVTTQEVRRRFQYCRVG